MKKLKARRKFESARNFYIAFALLSQNIVADALMVYNGLSSICVGKLDKKEIDLKKQSEISPEVKVTPSVSEKHGNAETPAKADSVAEHGLSADKKVMATHGFLRILSTIGKR